MAKKDTHWKKPAGPLDGAKEPSGQPKAQSSDHEGQPVQQTKQQSNPDSNEKTGPQDKTPPGGDRFPVVGVGASAGGLEALEEMFSQGAAQCKMAYVVVTHTSQDQSSMLPALLAKKTDLEVVEVTEPKLLKPSTIFIHPASKDLVVKNGEVVPVRREKQGGLHLPIDRLFTSLARELGERCAVVVLSGTGSDGSRALAAVKERDGLILVQDLETAKHGGMPQSALHTGLVDDQVISQEMCRVLSDYFATLDNLKPSEEGGDDRLIHKQEMETILNLLKSHTERDFTNYKKNTLIRRIQRRMAMTKATSAKKYILLLRKESEELDRLLQELLIGVTSFFRDKEAFDFLQEQVLPGLIRQVENGQALRVWVPGCASGEEAYSLAILLHETTRKMEAGVDYQIFATDIDTRALQRAREGIYPKAIAQDVSGERLSRYFVKKEEGESFQVRKEVRENIIFALQDVLRDPPFTRLDLVVCRNLLIYLESQAQKKLLPLFHYVLNPGGILFLGSSESLGEFSDLFSTVLKRWNIYRRREVSVGLRPEVHFPTGRRMLPKAAGAPETGSPGPESAIEVETSVAQVLLKEHTPAAVMVDDQGEVTYFHGRTGRYLEPAQGRPNANVHNLAREGLRFDLSSALRKAVSSRETVVRENVRVKTNGGHQLLTLTVEPLAEQSGLQGMYLILFKDQPEPRTTDKGALTRAETSDLGKEAQEHITALEKDLKQCRQEKRSTREELESTTEELRSSNEELQSSNEELQSTNEELESSREELQSLNEELSTVNSELEAKVEEISDAYENITAMFNSTRIPIVFLDQQFRLRRYTRAATDLIHMIDTDLGRPITHLKTTFASSDLEQVLQKVLDSTAPFRREVQNGDGRWFEMQVLTSRNREQRVNGLVMIFVDISEQKRAQQELEKMHQNEIQAARRYAENVVDTVRDAMLVLDENSRVISANASFYKKFQTSPEATEKKKLWELGNGQWDIPKLRELIERIRHENKPFEDYLVEHDFPGIGYRTMLLNARRLQRYDVGEERILLAMEDVTGKKRAGEGKDEG